MYISIKLSTKILNRQMTPNFKIVSNLLIVNEIFDMSNALFLSAKDVYLSAIVTRTNVLMQLKFKRGFEFQET